ncbi:hypothetical protein [Lysobacter gummosus]
MTCVQCLAGSRSRRTRWLACCLNTRFNFLRPPRRLHERTPPHPELVRR